MLLLPGLALAYQLYQEGVALALADINLKRLEETENLLKRENRGTGVQIYGVDVSNREQVYDFAKNTVDSFGKMDILINNAGVSSSGELPELRQELYDSHVAVTVVFPGGIKTNIARNSSCDYRMTPEIYEKGLQRFEESLKTTPEEAARMIIQGIRNKSPRVLIGKDAGK